MKKILTLCFLFILMPPVTYSLEQSQDYELTQVLILSRHNVRAPIIYENILTSATNKAWPIWHTNNGNLTTKGRQLEIYLGNYFRSWFDRMGLLRQDKCPDSNNVYVYANNQQRTIATAESFITGAFPDCLVKTFYRSDMNDGEFDPIFATVITDDSAEFKRQAESAMAEKLAYLDLAEAYKQVSTILDFKNSTLCKKDKLCDLVSYPNTMNISAGKEPFVFGPLGLAANVVDVFDLQYYEGFATKDVAWGTISTPEQWKTLNKIRNGYHAVAYKTKIVASNIAKPLLEYIDLHFVQPRKIAGSKLLIMFGHDSNIASVMSALDFAPYQLSEQYEKTPIGGKLVFQRWHSKKMNKDYLKVEYIYQSINQLRNGTALTWSNRPKQVTLALKNCPIDGNGLCHWDDYEKSMQQALKNKVFVD
ncbi:bifunctional glucose-1-phosphatase/inositol phosphatase [Arsenophonus nasoniae]|uniref:Bifunctional glucose-1-phosphatase/inositol phosphatase n=1 Tax=Arsenophonus nasoniae TaxID=638 RepID=A0AA95GFU4_9GAMM|nr:bifunctional glucose-1-phosphatase/inositol phosphatase [Arsenophonus nasoniae]WGL96204.1 bifunctional glucose-1-phosphatase/inositol phosphatase [Arsenophonus nasoniae]